jgi:8-oxo-dGTP pyrophosphatase MutT (NUDIX family)
MSFEPLRAALNARTPQACAVDAVPAEFLPEGCLQRAAVLVPLFERDGEPWILFTRRPAHLRRHAGQVSFPGGRVDPGDRDTLAAALREAQEEVGLEPARVDVLGALDECLVLASGFRLTPWVGCVPYPYPYVPRPEEVEEIFQAPLAALARPEAHRIELREAYGARHEVHYYAFGRQTIWGATARILSQLLAIWKAL